MISAGNKDAYLPSLGFKLVKASGYNERTKIITIEENL